MIYIIIGAGFLYIAISGGLFWYYYQKGGELIERSRPFSRDTSGGFPRILVVGDSTAVGTGVSDPRYSIAGRFAAAFPNIHLINRAMNGATVEDTIRQLEASIETQPFDLVLIQAGANDILHFAPLKTVPISRMLAEAKTRGKHVVWLTAGNIGLTPSFPWPLNWLFTHRTRQLRERALREAAALNIVYVDLFKERGQDPFESDIPRYYASDRLHLSDEGYGYWHQRIQEELTERSIDLAN